MLRLPFALLALLLTGGCAAGQERAAAGTFLRFLNAPGPDGALDDVPRLRLSIGGRAQTAEMDTGSTGIVVAALMIPDIDALPSLGPARLAYSSSGRVMEGRWVVTPVTVAGADGASVTTPPLPVLAVTRVSCFADARNCTPDDAPRHIAMLGIGFGREGDHQSQSTPDRNPFLALPALREGGLRRGYVVTRHGVQVGLDGDAAAQGFHPVRLRRGATPGDWAAAPACIALAPAAPPACGTLLMDTGVSRSFLTVTPAQLDGVTQPSATGEDTLRPGTRIGVQLDPAGDPGFGYGFAAQDAADPVAPRGITLVGTGRRPVFLNTSFHFLNGFDHLFDADRGLIGYRPRR